MPCADAMSDLIIPRHRVSIRECWFIMQTTPRYFISPGRFAFNSASLIKFDGQYSYWGTWSKRWIHDPTLSKQYWIEEYLHPITEQEVQKIINEKEKG
jgi:hypothetical protein